MIARVFEALLQLLALLYFGRQLAVCDLQLPARVRDGVAGAMQAVHEVVRRECEQPGHRGEQTDRQSQVARRIPA